MQESITQLGVPVNIPQKMPKGNTDAGKTAPSDYIAL